MAVAMTVGITATAHAEDFVSSRNWLVDFDGDKMNSNFSSQEMAEEIYGILPGDTMELQVKIKNSGKDDTDWYMSNEVLESLEEGSAAEGGAYTYVLSYYDPSGEEAVLYDSQTVGGEGSVAGLEGLHQATDSLEDYFYLDRLTKGETAAVYLRVELDGETQGNSYQNTLASLQMNFAVEKAAPATRVEQGEDTIIRKTVTGASNTVRRTITRPKTGDTTNILLYSAIALASGIVLLVLGVITVKRRRENEKGELKS